MKQVSFNQGWQFTDLSGQNVDVTLPHDAMISQKRHPNAPSGSAQAYFPGGRYVYIKRFDAPHEWKRQHIIIRFEGVYANGRVYLNDTFVGGTVYGYNQFDVTLDNALRYGEMNELRVIADNSAQPDSRWYTGAGIYRPVWLLSGPKNGYLMPESVKIKTIDFHTRTIQVNTQNDSFTPNIVIQIKDGDTLIAQAKGPVAKITLTAAKLWTPNHPHLYTCIVTAYQDEEAIDQAACRFGIRQISLSNQGLLINGQGTSLRGGCIHHSQGLLGAATYDESEWRRIQKLKVCGFNAIRSAHNPLSRAALEACDYFGMLVIDEAWDMWYNHKSKADYASAWEKHHRQDLAAMVQKDFNHPSVIFYSIGNEVAEPASKEGLMREKEMISLLHTLDSTRPVTAGLNLMILKMAAKGGGIYNKEGGRDTKQQPKMNSTLFNMMASVVGTGMNRAANGAKADKATTPALDMLDVAGYNYASGRYAKEGKLHPQRVIYGSETFPQDLGKNWEMVKQYPYLIGDFMWTAWDYLGEVGLGAWAYTPDAKSFDKPYPWLLADCGAFDILGNPGAAAGYAQAVWNQTNTPFVGVRPLNHPHVKVIKAIWRGSNAISSWAWRDCDQAEAVVDVYSNQPRVELRLNGKRLGIKQTKLSKAQFKVRYIPGTLEVAALDAHDSVVGITQLNSTRGALQLVAAPETITLKPGQIAYIPVDVKDKAGVVESNHDVDVQAIVHHGDLLAFGSANPRTEQQYTTGAFRTYYGRALAIVRATAPGVLTLRLTSVLGTTETTITVTDS